MNRTETARARKLLTSIAKATDELRALLGDGDANELSRFDRLDWNRRRRPEWRRRGRVFYAIAQVLIVLNAGYSDLRGSTGFFRGDPIPVLARDGDDVVLTARGRDAARFYEQYWLGREDGG
jgi:hypothetical protein